MGRHYGGAPTCEMHPSIDVRRGTVRADSALVNRFRIHGPHAGEPCGSIRCGLNQRSVMLSFHARDWNCETNGGW